MNCALIGVAKRFNFSLSASTFAGNSLGLPAVSRTLFQITLSLEYWMTNDFTQPYSPPFVTMPVRLRLPVKLNCKEERSLSEIYCGISFDWRSRRSQLTIMNSFMLSDKGIQPRFEFSFMISSGLRRIFDLTEPESRIELKSTWLPLIAPLCTPSGSLQNGSMGSSTVIGAIVDAVVELLVGATVESVASGITSSGEGVVVVTVDAEILLHPRISTCIAMALFQLMG